METPNIVFLRTNQARILRPMPLTNRLNPSTIVNKSWSSQELKNPRFLDNILMLKFHLNKFNPQNLLIQLFPFLLSQLEPQENLKKKW